MYPIEILPDSVLRFAMLLPSTRAIVAAREVVIFGGGLADIWTHLVYLVGFGVFSILLSMVVFRFVQKKAMLIGI